MIHPSSLDQSNERLSITPTNRCCVPASAAGSRFADVINLGEEPLDEFAGSPQIRFGQRPFSERAKCAPQQNDCHKREHRANYPDHDDIEIALAMSRPA